MEQPNIANEMDYNVMCRPGWAWSPLSPLCYGAATGDPAARIEDMERRLIDCATDIGKIALLGSEVERMKNELLALDGGLS